MRARYGLVRCLSLALLVAAVPAQEEALVTAINDFAGDIYQRLAVKAGKDNLCVSPASIAVSVLMAHAGAAGTTEAGMERVLRLARYEKGERTTSLDGDELRTAVTALMAKLNLSTEKGNRPRRRGGPMRRPEVRVVNALWGQEGQPFRKEYVVGLQKHYAAQVAAVDFNTDPRGAAERINGWVAKATDDRIREIVPPDMLLPDTRLVLANAIWFRGVWREQFEADKTEPATFHLEGGDADAPVRVPTMHHTKTHRFFADEKLAAVQLRYQGSTHAMVFLLPAKGTRMAAFEKTLTPARLRMVLDSLDVQRVDLALPKFGIATSLRLREVLAAMGMPSAFDGRKADFSGIQEGGEALSIDAVLHKTTIDVNEYGTEASAATAHVLLGRSSREPVRLAMDRPFVFLLRDLRTGLILFQGRVMDPRG